MKLKNAMLCLDCDSIYDGGRNPEDGKAARECPHCGSRARWPLAMWIKPLQVLEANFRELAMMRRQESFMRRQAREYRYPAAV